MALLKQELKTAKIPQLTIEQFALKLGEYNSIVNIKAQENVSEENLKSDLQRFLSEAFSYQTQSDYDKIDLTLWENGQLKTIIETKSIGSGDMIVESDFNRKSFHQALFYYMDQQAKSHNAIESIIITDYKTMFVIRDIIFKELSQRKPIKNAFEKYGKDKDTCYKEFRDIFVRENYEIKYYMVDLNDFKQSYQLLSPEFLYNKPLSNDSNSLNRKFYDELLYIIGLQENKELLIKSEIKNSLLDITEQMIGKKDNFELALGLNILWLNRILFLKILESQLKTFRNDKEFTILSPQKITGYHLLSKLFFNILSKPKKERHEDDHKTYNLVPYLNSSLFEETELEKNYGIKNLDIERKITVKKDSILFNDKNFKHKELNLLEYLLRFLNCYQFNNDGDNPDPNTTIKSSVLGLVFEKLNGYKDGSHFTPAGITMYMSKEIIQRKVLDEFNQEFEISCENFNELKEFVFRNCYKGEELEKAQRIVNSVSIIDPAVGSGHFLVSGLNELIRVKSELGLLHKDIKVNIQDDELVIKSGFGDEFLYQIKDGKITTEKQAIQRAIFDTKKHIIESQLYGIDINPNSVNICRLRLWIELLKHTYYTDSEYTDLEVLPNLEFKVMTANSLISLKKESNVLVATEYESLKDSLQQKFRDYYTASHDKNEIKQQIVEILEKMKTMTSFSLDGKDQIEQLKAFSPFNTTVTAPFFDSSLMFGVDHFDVVLMNPPYFALQSLAKKDNPYQDKIFDTYASTGDIYQLFIEKAFQFINDNGLVSAIVSNKWMRAGYGEGTRKWLYKNAHTIEVLDLGSGWFDSAAVDTNIITYEKRGIKPYQTMIPAYTMNNKVNSIEEGKQTTEQKYIVPTQKGDSWIIMNEIETRILEKMKRAGKPLKDWDITINRGVLTGFNEAFIIDGATKDRLIAEDPKSAEIIKPLLRGRDIKRYSYAFADKWLLATFPALKLNIDEYPAVKKYLEQFRPGIDQTGDKGSRKKTNNKWFETQDTIAYHQDFDKPKIVWGEIVQQAEFTYEVLGIYPEATTFLMAGEHLIYLVGILNAEFSEYLFRKFFAGGGLGEKGFRYKKAFLERMPIPMPNTKQEQQITELVQTILQKKEQSLPTDDQEKEIDLLVYQLYGLTEEEIAVVERKDRLE